MGAFDRSQSYRAWVIHRSLETEPLRCSEECQPLDSSNGHWNWRRRPSTTYWCPKRWAVGLFFIRKMTTCLIGLMCLITADFGLSLIWGLIWSYVERFVWFHQTLHQTVSKIAVKTLLRHFQTVSSPYDFWLCTLDAFMVLWQMSTTKHGS